MHFQVSMWASASRAELSTTSGAPISVGARSLPYAVVRFIMMVPPSKCFFLYAAGEKGERTVVQSNKIGQLRVG